MGVYSLIGALKKKQFAPKDKLFVYVCMCVCLQELLVYRCALMCAQFPMLSAPCPPDGRSPTPPPLILPSVFKTTTLAEEDQFEASDPSLLSTSGTSSKVSE